MMRRLWAVALAVAMLFAGCSSTASAPTLDGTSWIVSQIKGDATLSDVQPTMTFGGARVSGQASCNTYSAGYTQTGASVHIDAVASTAMACLDPRRTAEETAFLAALAEVTQVRGTAQQVELLNASGVVVLTLAVPATKSAKPLVGTTWTLSGVLAGSAVTSPISGTTVSLTFTGTQVNGKACNTFRGPVKVAGATIAIGPLASTTMACPNEAEGKQETTVLSILDAATGYSIEGDTLTVTAPDAKGLTFSA